jgi:hypothetical protein
MSQFATVIVIAGLIDLQFKPTFNTYLTIISIEGRRISCSSCTSSPHWILGYS